MDIIFTGKYDERLSNGRRRLSKWFQKVDIHINTLHSHIGKPDGKSTLQIRITEHKTVTQIKLQRVDQWKQLVANHPTGILCPFGSRSSMGTFRGLDERIIIHQMDETYYQYCHRTLPVEIGQSDPLTDAAQLNQLGMFDEAQTAFAPLKNTSTTTFAINARLVAEENWSTGHDLLHKYIQKHPPHTWTENQAEIWYQAYPNQYWDLLKAHATEPPR